MKLPMTPRALAAVAGGLAAVAFATWWGWPRDKGGGGGSSARADGGSGAGPNLGVATTAIDAGAAGGPITAVTRLSPEQRRTLGAQIAAARARARQRALADGGTADDGGIDPADVVIPLERVQGELKQALEDSIKILADCYEQQPGGPGARDAAVLLRLTSDPDFGTVIDTDEITDGSGAKLAPALDECLRDSIDSLALPPLGEGGKLDLKYTFVFDDDAPDRDAR